MVLPRRGSGVFFGQRLPTWRHGSPKKTPDPLSFNEHSRWRNGIRAIGDLHRPAQGVEDRINRIAGAILGTAVGDAIGLPGEGLPPQRAARLFGTGPFGHRFIFGRGMVSDDTEHTCMIAQALLAAPEDADAFVRCLGWKLRWWLLGIPAGIGLGTLRAILKLWLGFPPERSGVLSAGNGPAMRVAILGVCIDQDDEKLRSYVQVSTRLTHTDSRAEQGALIIALAARHATKAQTVDPT